MCMHSHRDSTELDDLHILQLIFQYSSAAGVLKIADY